MCLVCAERVIQDGLYYEFTRYCPGAVVRMYGEAPDKLWAVVKFKKYVCLMYRTCKCTL